MSDQIRISAKNLGALALPGFCPRCFWQDMHLSNTPARTFPGIFSSIDSYTKKIVHGWFDAHGALPEWFNELGDITGYKPAPHHTKFFIEDKPTNIKLTGVLDDIFVRPDGSHLLVDYKTAKYTKNQDELMPEYVVQLNAYALIGEQRGLSPVSGLVLIYMEPITEEDAGQRNANMRDRGFALGFKPNFHPVEMRTAMIAPLLRKVRDLADLSSAPVGLDGCDECAYRNELAELIGVPALCSTIPAAT